MNLKVIFASVLFVLLFNGLNGMSLFHLDEELAQLSEMVEDLEQLPTGQPDGVDRFFNQY